MQKNASLWAEYPQYILNPFFYKTKCGRKTGKTLLFVKVIGIFPSFSTFTTTHAVPTPAHALFLHETAGRSRQARQPASHNYLVSTPAKHTHGAPPVHIPACRWIADISYGRLSGRWSPPLFFGTSGIDIIACPEQLQIDKILQFITHPIGRSGIEKILKDKVVDVIFRRTGQYFLSAQVEAFTTIRQERVFDIAYVSSHGIIARLPALALEIVHDVADGH